METNDDKHWSDEQGNRRPSITGNDFIKLERRVAALEKELLLLKKELEARPPVERT